MKLKDYIVDNWAELPKSSFNESEVVIFQCDEDYDGGWGHHSYAGWGVTVDGDIAYCYSSGCSCSGDGSIDTAKDVKVLIADNKISDVDPESVNFKDLEVHFRDY